MKNKYTEDDLEHINNVRKILIRRFLENNNVNECININNEHKNITRVKKPKNTKKCCKNA